MAVLTNKWKSGGWTAMILTFIIQEKIFVSKYAILANFCIRLIINRL